MTDMITRVSRAILKRRYYEPEFYTDEESFYLDCDPDHVMEAEADARAAIEAMREPTDEMLEAMAAPFEWGFGVSDAREAFQRAIDAALASPTLEDARER